MKISAGSLRRLLCVMIMIGALLGLPNVVSSQTGTTVEFPASSNVFTCQSSLIQVRVENVTGLTAYHLEIDFPPGDVQVTAVENGGFIPNGIFEPTNAIDNTAGTVVFGMARRDYNTQPVDGGGVLIYLSVQGVNPGAAVNFTIRPYVEGSESTNGTGSMLVGWPDLTPIPYTITNGTVYTQSCTSTDIQLSNNQINENLPVGTPVGTFTTIDPDNETGFSYTFTSTGTYPDNAYFTIGGVNGDELRTNAIFNFENDPSYKIRVRSTSSSGLWIEREFTITVTDANDPPVLGAIGAKSVNEHALLAFTATASDADTLPAPDTLTFSLAAGTAGLVPSGASIDSSSGAFTWTPAEDQGPGTHTFDVCVNDGLASDCETIIVTVNEVNAAPGGADQTVTTLEDTGKIFAAANFPITDASDSPPNTLAAVKIVSLPSVGTLKVNGVNAAINQFVTLAQLNAGALVYTPALNGNGTGYASFTFQVQDDGGGATSLDPTPNIMTIDVTPVKDAPLAIAQAKSVDEDSFTSITLTGSDVDGNPLTYTVVTLPSHGTLSGSGATRTYTPAANYNGPDSFTFKVNDGTVDSSPATVSITVTPVNDPPVGVADHYYLNNVMFYDTDNDPKHEKDTYLVRTVAPGVLTNDSDVDGDTLTANIKTPPSIGTLKMDSGDGSFEYRPNDQNLLQGTDSFVYTLSDGHGESKDVTVNITIDLVGPAVVAQWLSPVTALAGIIDYTGITYDASTATVPLKVFVSGISDVAKVEFRWYDHTQEPDGVWYIVETDYTPTMENGKYVYTATLNTDSMPFVDDIQLWAYTYDVAGSYTRWHRKIEGDADEYWSRILVNHNPSGYNVFLPFIRR